MANTRDDVKKLFEDHFSTKLKKTFDENFKIKDIKNFDSLEMVNLALDFEDKFDTKLSLASFKNAVYFREIIDEAFMKVLNK